MTGVPIIRDYPCGTLAQARYSWALLKRDLKIGVIDQTTYTRHATKALAAIARFCNELNGRGIGHSPLPDVGAVAIKETDSRD